MNQCDEITIPVFSQVVRQKVCLHFVTHPPPTSNSSPFAGQLSWHRYSTRGITYSGFRAFNISETYNLLLYVELDCIVLHCIVLYCIEMYCITLYCIVLHWNVLYVLHSMLQLSCINRKQDILHRSNNMLTYITKSRKNGIENSFLDSS